MKKYAVIVAAVVGLLSAEVYAQSMDTIDTSKQNFPFVYSVKFLCGLQVNPSGGPNTPPPLEPPVKPGNYATSVNIHNFRVFENVIFNKVVLSGGAISPFIGLVLGPNKAIAIDCTQIAKMLPPPLPSFIEGFVEIGSRRQLSVTAVYTSQTCENPSEKCTRLGQLSLEVVPQPFFRG